MFKFLYLLSLLLLSMTRALTVSLLYNNNNIVLKTFLGSPYQEINLKVDTISKDTWVCINPYDKSSNPCFIPKDSRTFLLHWK